MKVPSPDIGQKLEIAGLGGVLKVPRRGGLVSQPVQIHAGVGQITDHPTDLLTQRSAANIARLGRGIGIPLVILRCNQQIILSGRIVVGPPAGASRQVPQRHDRFGVALLIDRPLGIADQLPNRPRRVDQFRLAQIADLPAKSLGVGRSAGRQRSDHHRDRDQNPGVKTKHGNPSPAGPAKNEQTENRHCTGGGTGRAGRARERS